MRECYLLKLCKFEVFNEIDFYQMCELDSQIILFDDESKKKKDITLCYELDRNVSVKKISFVLVYGWIKGNKLIEITSELLHPI